MSLRPLAVVPLCALAWEGGTAIGPGFILAAPGATEAIAADSGAVIGVRGSLTGGGAALSTSPADLLTVTR